MNGIRTPAAKAATSCQMKGEDRWKQITETEEEIPETTESLMTDLKIR